MAKEGKKLVIDVDVVIEKYNKDNPDARQLNRKELAEKLDVNPQLLSDWKRGKTPNIIPRLQTLMELGGCGLNDFVKELQDV
jgi:transcriptional regulator with XRE-family HTH domain